MRVRCAGSDAIFHVHESLLRNNAPDLNILQGSHGFLSAEVDSTHDAIELFVTWIYTQEMPGDFGAVIQEIKLFIPAYAFGAEVGCMVFADMMLDELMNRMTSDSGHFPIDEIIEASAYLEKGSGGWNFLMDFLVQKTPLNCGKQLTSICEALSKVENHVFFSELAKRICEDMRVEVPRADCNNAFSKMLISGYFAVRVHAIEEYPDDGTYPWTENPCEYHLHTERDEPCYTTKR